MNLKHICAWFQLPVHLCSLHLFCALSFKKKLCSLAQYSTNKWFKAATFWSEGYKCTETMFSFADGEERINYAKERVKKQGANAINYPITAGLSLPTCLCADTMLLSLQGFIVSHIRHLILDNLNFYSISL